MHRLPPPVLLATLLALVLARDASAGELVAVTPAGSNPGQLEMFEYVPPDLPSGAPLVVLLHGCSQTAADFAAQAGWLELADRLGIALLAPQQTEANNPGRCFDWFRPAEGQQDAGQALSIRQMTDQVVAAHDLDPDRLFVTGASAGGYLTAALLAIYPDVFAAGAVIAGGPFGCADDLASALACMEGTDRSPEAWADEVRGAAEPAGSWPRISIWHGTEDRVVDHRNAHELVEQWRAVHDLLEAEATVDSVAGQPRRRYGRPGQAPAVELVSLAGMGHAVPVAPNAGAEGCGEAGRFAADVGVCAALEIARFWQLSDAGRDDDDRGPDDRSDDEASGGSGCQLGAASGALALPALVLVVAVLRRRRRATPARCG